MVEQERHAVVDLARVDDVVVVEHQHDVGREAARSLSSVVSTVSIGGRCSACSWASALSPTPGATVRRAAMT